MAADLIENLPEEGDTNREALESVARNVCGVTYLGVTSIYALKLSRSLQRSIYSWIGDHCHHGNGSSVYHRKLPRRTN